MSVPPPNCTPNQHLHRIGEVFRQVQDHVSKQTSFVFTTEATPSPPRSIDA